MKNKRLFLIIGLIVFLAGLIVVGWYFFMNKPATIDAKYLTIDLSQAVADRTTEYNEALATLQSDPQDYKARRMIGIIKDVTGDYDGAEAIYLELLHELPTDVLVMNNLANIYYNTKRYTEAEKVNFDIIAENSKWTSAYTSLKDIYTWQLKDANTDKYLEALLFGYNNYPEMKVEFSQLLRSYYTDIEPSEAEVAKYPANVSNDASALPIFDIKVK
jgi:tetratricopeptide (TPR) repeat protein